MDSLHQYTCLNLIPILFSSNLLHILTIEVFPNRGRIELMLKILLFHLQHKISTFFESDTKMGSDHCLLFLLLLFPVPAQESIEVPWIARAFSSCYTFAYTVLSPQMLFSPHTPGNVFSVFNSSLIFLFSEKQVLASLSSNRNSGSEAFLPLPRELLCPFYAPLLSNLLFFKHFMLFPASCLCLHSECPSF